MDIITRFNKKELRKTALKSRDELAKKGVTVLNSSLIISKIINSKDFQNAKHIALYYPIKNEIDLRGLFKTESKNFYLPKCNSNNEIEFIKYENENSLTTGKYNIKEPKGEIINPYILDIIYIPALMANRKNFRLGYGKGCYDRFFYKNKNLKAKKVIVIANQFISENFKEDEFDIQCDYIISE